MHARHALLLALLATLACTKTAPPSPTAPDASPAPAPEEQLAFDRLYDCSDLTVVGLYGDPPIAPWGRDDAPSRAPGSSTTWDDQSPFVRAMVSSISVDPPTIPAASAVASALKRGPTAPGPSTERTFLLTPLDLIAGRIARARVRFQVGAHGAVDGVDVGLADATPDGGMPPQRQSAMSALASATCAMAPFSDVPQGTRVTYWFDRIAAGFDAGGVTEDERSSSPAPRIRAGSVNVNGRLPPEVIERIVKQRFGRFRLCYEAALKTNPTLTGRITVKFVIDRTGAVAAARDGGSDLPDANAVACVVRAFGDLSFPQPEGGIVTVVYPMMFFPGA